MHKKKSLTYAVTPGKNVEQAVGVPVKVNLGQKKKGK